MCRTVRDVSAEFYSTAKALRPVVFVENYTSPVVNSIQVNLLCLDLVVGVLIIVAVLPRFTGVRQPNIFLIQKKYTTHENLTVAKLGKRDDRAHAYALRKPGRGCYGNRDTTGSWEAA
ncbi:hypothetical protein NDU88_010334 [Pleurodeles waltl]|uniref:Uncharacterized protein n=1 Tax=Pleurodeles waltl TaxID=8319 RepID=A0AAV7RZB8_PLEWA|nr:hypothetical protein NDU88_010334 [Pleurodeles waltl]